MVSSSLSAGYSETSRPPGRGGNTTPAVDQTLIPITSADAETTRSVTRSKLLLFREKGKHPFQGHAHHLGADLRAIARQIEPLGSRTGRGREAQPHLARRMPVLRIRAGDAGRREP